MQAENADRRRERSDGPQDAVPSVLCVIPCLNEATHLDGLIASLLAEEGSIKLRVVVVDGGSSDGSRAIVRKYMMRDGRVSLLENSKRVQSAAVNKAVEIHGDGAEFLIRVDAHCDYPARYCERLLAVQSESKADSVVVNMRAKGRTCFQSAAAAAQNSILGNGGSAHRNETVGRFVDHGHHALMRVSAYKAIGGYDESFFWNEDAELDVRMRGEGFRIYLAGAPSIVYFPRRTIGALLRQYFNYGRGRACNFLKHHERLRLRQMLPLAVAPAVGMLLLVPVSALFAIPALAWAVSCVTYGVYLSVRARQLCAAASGIAAIAMHLGWSLGFFACLLTRILWAPNVPHGVNAQAAS
jgi:succinoglycan biosynthesis protein ExoA